MSTVRVRLPPHLERLAEVRGEVQVQVSDTPTVAEVLGGLEAAHPVLEGTIRQRDTAERRALIRLFACGRDLSHDAPGAPLPPEVASGSEPLQVVGAIAGG